jgi:uncharacterized protein (TIGR03067 family)
VDKQLVKRPNLDHLKGQAKKLRDRKKIRLSEAQSVVARQNGFKSWTVLSRHVEQLRALEGDWRIARLEVDGNDVPATMLATSRILIDGDRFRTESPEGTYEGIFTIDTEASPPRFDVHFVAGPEAGNDSLGIFRIDGPDQFTLCLGLVGSSRPTTFAAKPGSGHALEQLRRVSAARPDNVTGGTPPPPVPEVAVVREDPAAFAVEMTPMFERLQGEWRAVELCSDGKPMPAQWLSHGKRTMKGNEIKVVFGGQTMIHAKVRIDERATPIAIDYLSLMKKGAGTVTYGIMEWLPDGDVRFLMASAGAPRPTEFDEKPASGTYSRWRR